MNTENTPNGLISMNTVGESQAATYSENHKVGKTPFWVRKRTDDEKFDITFGVYPVGKGYDLLEEAVADIETLQWDILLNVISVVIQIDKADETKKFNEWMKQQKLYEKHQGNEQKP